MSIQPAFKTPKFKNPHFVVHNDMFVSSLVLPGKKLHEANNSLDFPSIYHLLTLKKHLREGSMHLSTEFSFLFCILSDLLIRGNAIKRKVCKVPFVLAVGLNKRDDFVAGV